MWIFTRDGFYSIVQKKWDVGTLTVRARREEDLVALRKYYPELAITTTRGTDYPYRTQMPRSVMSEIMALEVDAIDYDNFKNTIADNARHNIYLRVWGAMLSLMPPGVRGASAYGSSTYGSNTQPRTKGKGKKGKRDPWPWQPKQSGDLSDAEQEEIPF